MVGHNLLVLSDIHLGSDLVQHSRPLAPARGIAGLRRDRELSALLDWYRERAEGGRPWRLVIAGDFIDFVGMSVSPAGDDIETELNDEERRHGLGSSVDHTLAKLRLVAEHHDQVFAALARFIQAGNTLVVVRGNHDVDFHWQPVQEALRAILARHAAIATDSVEFADWFYYEEDRIYIEHGHQYDDFCSYEHVLNPVLPSDPRRSHRSLSDVLLRYVVRPTRGMTEAGHDSASVVDYLRFAARLGFGGLFGLGRRFVVAVAALMALWREHFSDAAQWVRQEHERRMALLAEARHISLIKLKALASLQRPPVTRSLLRILAGVMLDRVAVAVLAFGALIWIVVARWTLALGLELAAVTALLVALAWFWRRARGALDASQSLRDHAARVASLLPAAFVVMGHTHLPEIRRTGDGVATYVNLGAWAEEDSADGAPPLLPASRTHLVVRETEGRLVAVLLRWDAERGPGHFADAQQACLSA
jgi:UDP-2,3-diacylglucosamine pyrophosphatase LpxH